MSNIKDVLGDNEQALARTGAQLDPAILREVVDAALGTHIALDHDISNVRSPQLEIQHRILKAVLMRLHGVQKIGEAAFNSRLKHLLDLGLIEDRRLNGRGRRTYGLVDVFEMALCLQLQRSFIPPATAVRFVTENREALDQRWAEFRTPHRRSLDIAMDAFAMIGDKGREDGKGARGNECHALAIGTLPRPANGSLRPSILSVDLVDLQWKVVTELKVVLSEGAITDGQLSGI
jgi:hypothetical protein